MNLTLFANLFVYYTSRMQHDYFDVPNKILGKSFVFQNSEIYKNRINISSLVLYR